MSAPRPPPLRRCLICPCCAGLCAITGALDAKNNASVAVLLPCANDTDDVSITSPATTVSRSCRWNIDAAAPSPPATEQRRQVLIRAAVEPGLCLGTKPTVWPIPVFRNYLVALYPCHHGLNTFGPTDVGVTDPVVTTWNQDADSGAVVSPDGRCLDAGTAALPVPPKCCENATVWKLLRNPPPVPPCMAHPRTTHCWEGKTGSWGAPPRAIPCTAWG